MENDPLEEKPALVINVRSIWTPILAVIMLVVGLVAGYFLRPYIPGGTTGNTAVSTEPVVAQSAGQAQSTSAPQPTMSATDKQKLMDALIKQTRHFKGDPNAPVTIIEFSDFQCPYCGRFATTTEPQIYDAYLNDGKVRLGYIHFAFLGDESTWAAEASECAADQKKFWEYHDLLFKSQSGENQGAFSKDNLKKFASDLGLDTKAFNECLDTSKHADLVQQDIAFGQSLGINSTPAFAVDGTPLLGAQPFDVFKKLIEEGLAGN